MKGVILSLDRSSDSVALSALLVERFYCMRKSFNDFVQWKGTHAPRASECYQVVLNRFDTYIGSKIEICEADYTAFIYSEQARVSGTTMNGVISALKGLARYLHDTRQSDVPPSLIRHLRYAPKQRVFVTKADLGQLMDSLNMQSVWEVRKALCLSLLWDTGIRVSELIGLNLGDIDLQSRTACIRTKKNHQFRYIQWGDATHSLLVKYLGVRVCVDTNNDALLLSITTNQRVTPRSVQRWIEEIRIKSHINKKISPHSFRHGKAHAMLGMGATVKDIQVVLGHSETNPRAAFQYLRLNEDEQRQILRRFV